MEGQRYPVSYRGNRNARPGGHHQSHHQGSYEQRNNPHNMHHQHGAQGSSGNPYNDWYHPAFKQGSSNGQPKQWHQYANGYQHQNRKALSCGPCNRSFFSQQKLDEHMNDHVECPFPECKLSAHIKVIDQHINNQHMLVNFASLQIDDEAWILERKKRFPTAHRAELRREQQMEKIKRGEKLGISSKPFDKMKDNRDKSFKRGRDNSQQRGRDNSQRGRYSSQQGGRDSSQQRGRGSSQQRGRGSSQQRGRDSSQQRGRDSSHQRSHENQEEGKSNDSSAVGSEDRKLEEKSFHPNSSHHAKRFKRERPPPRPIPTIDVDLYESEEEVLGVSRFRGTRQFYESTGEVNYFSSNRVTKKLPEHDIVISDDEEWETGKNDESKNTETLVLGGALGSLMGSYSDSEEETEVSAMPVSDVKAELISSAPVETVHNAKKPSEQEQLENQNNDDKSKRFRFKRKARPHNRRGKRPNNFIRAPRRRKTLLEKLLQADIIHERNIILQCVHYVVENNFFGGDVKTGSIKEKSETSDNEANLVLNREVNETNHTSEPEKESEVCEIESDHSKTELKKEITNSSESQEKSKLCDNEANLVSDKEKVNETKHTSEPEVENEVCETESDHSKTELKNEIANSSDSHEKSELCDNEANLVSDKEKVNETKHTSEPKEESEVCETESDHSKTELKNEIANSSESQEKSELCDNEANLVSDKEKVNETKHTSEPEVESEVCETESDHSKTELKKEITNSSESQEKSELVSNKEKVSNTKSISESKEGSEVCETESDDSKTELKNETVYSNEYQGKEIPDEVKGGEIKQTSAGEMQMKVIE